MHLLTHALKGFVMLKNKKIEKNWKWEGASNPNSILFFRRDFSIQLQKNGFGGGWVGVVG